MTKKDTAETINNLDGLTIGHLFQLVRKIKFSALLSMFALFSSIIGGAYALGKNSQQKDTAVMLHSPFSMRLEVEDKKFDFTNLTLMKDPALTTLNEDTMVLSIREIKSDFDIIPVGRIVAKVEKEKLSWPWSLFASNTKTEDTTVAMTEVEITLTSAVNFNWNGHQGDYDFTEKFVTEDMVNRFYSDGCILEYRVNAERRSMPETFRWIKSVH